MELSPGMIGALPILLAILVFIAHRYYTRWRGAQIRSKPFPQQWLAYLIEHVPPYASLAADEKERLLERVKVFLAEKAFYGCGGLEVTDEMRVTIAGEACLLIMNHEGPVYPGLSSILVYPSAFIANRQVHLDNGTVMNSADGMLGESWDVGKVILSWDDVLRGVGNFSDGHNVGLHEFAHQLDTQAGSANGAPPLRHNSYKTWAKVLSRHYEDLQSRVKHDQVTVIDPYATTNPAEFFAVVTETFFERPGALKQRRPDLYDELKAYYCVDPTLWHDGKS